MAIPSKSVFGVATQVENTSPSKLNPPKKHNLTVQAEMLQHKKLIVLLKKLLPFVLLTSYSSFPPFAAT